MEKKAKSLPADIETEILQDMLALSYADSALQSEKVRFFQMWEISNVAAVKVFVNNFKEEWCNERLGNWSHRSYSELFRIMLTMLYKDAGVLCSVFCVFCVRVFNVQRSMFNVLCHHHLRINTYVLSVFVLHAL